MEKKVIKIENPKYIKDNYVKMIKCEFIILTIG